MHSHEEHIILSVSGMDCSSCAQTISRQLEKKGLGKVNVNFATGEASFDIKNHDQIKLATKSIEELGYKVLLHDHSHDDQAHQGHNHAHDNAIEKKFYFTLIFTVPLFFHMFIPFELLNNPIVQLLLCLPVLTIGIMHFGRSAWKSLKVGIPNMDVLIAIGSTSAFIYSLAGTIMFYGTHEVHNYMFYETSATIITLVLLGNVLEHRSVNGTTSAIRDLTKMQVTKARKITLINGSEEISDIEYKAIQVNDVLLVNTGDKIPVDGEIIYGSGSIDESMISGESLPVEKNIGGKVIGGTILNSGSIKVKTLKIGKDTVLAHIIELVKNAQQQKPTIQKLGDKASAIFVPVVLGISLLTFLLSNFVFDIGLQKALMHSIAVLVISCPCAMGLATPTAVMVGIGRAAKSGILIKGGSTLEQFAGIKNIVFDKTGTLTTGNFKIKKIEPIGIEKDELIRILYHVEKHSSHPIANSIVSGLGQQDIPAPVLSAIKEKKGVGLYATDSNNNNYVIGSYAIAQHLTKDDHHNVYIIKNDSLAGWVDLEDEIKTSAAAVINELKANHIKTILLSGDNSYATNSLGQKLNFDIIHGEQLPEEKLKKIETFVQEAGTAMVGDGINDAPALAKATVGISLGNATEVAIQSAQIVLLNGNDLLKIDEAYRISKHTLKTIKQNLFWAFFYNVVAIPIAAFGFLNPMVGALAMAFSDVIVIGNSIRLKTKNIK